MRQNFCSLAIVITFFSSGNGCWASDEAGNSSGGPNSSATTTSSINNSSKSVSSKTDWQDGLSDSLGALKKNAQNTATKLERNASAFGRSISYNMKKDEQNSSEPKREENSGAKETDSNAWGQSFNDVCHNAEKLGGSLVNFIVSGFKQAGLEMEKAAHSFNNSFSAKHNDESK